MKTLQTLLFMAFSLMAFAANAQMQYISNITVAQRSDASGLVDVHFDMVAIPANDYYISFSVSFDTGNTFNAVPREFMTGDTGPISPGTGYHIVWDGLHSFPETYGPQSQLKIHAVSCPETVTDIDGNIYQTVPIGSQCWMNENLKTTKYRNGAQIEYPGSDNLAWTTNTTGAYAWYNNEISWKNIYGALYNWHAVDNSDGICPAGWHVPSIPEIVWLIDYLGINLAGNKLKSCRQIDSPLGAECNTTEHPRWESHETEYGTDDFYFTGFPGGLRRDNGSFYAIGAWGCWWTSSGIDFYFACDWKLANSGSGVSYPWYDNKWHGFSIRCTRDNNY